MHYSNPIESKEFRQQLRRKATPCERMLWKHLRGRQTGLKFRQQHGFGPYIMDFYCPEIRLCIEVDGSVHDSNEAQHKDAERTAFLRDHGIRVIRFRNEEIEKDMDGVMLQIREIIDKQTGHHRYQKEENV